MKYTSKKGWFEIDGKNHYFKSDWEKSYALWLSSLQKARVIKSWEYEPTTFYFEGIKRGVTNYKPDFKITYMDGSWEWIEIKGYMDKRSATKIKRFKKYFPDENLRVLGLDDIKALRKTYALAS